MVLEYTPAALAVLLNEVDTARADAVDGPFRVGGVRLAPVTILRRRFRWHRLARAVATPLEVGETALHLVHAAIAGCPGAPTPTASKYRSVSRRRDMVVHTQAAIAAAPTDAWSLHALARRSHCSPFHLAHAFRADVGLPIHRYLLLMRLSRTLDAVLDTRRSLTMVALEAGFAHHSHFTATFRRTFGITPSGLRRTGTTLQSAELRKFLRAPRPRW